MEGKQRLQEVGNSTLFGRAELRRLTAAFVGCFRPRSVAGNMGMGILGVSPAPEN